MQKSLVVTAFWDAAGNWSDDTDELNELLEQGYKVVSATPMGAFGYGFPANEQSYGVSKSGFASLVIVEK